MRLAFKIAAITLGALSTQISRAQDTIVPLDFSSWKYFSATTQQFQPPASGVFEMTSEGLRFYGDTYRGSAGIETLQAFNLSEKTLYTRWKAHGAQNFMGIEPCLTIPNVADLRFIGVPADQYTDVIWELAPLLRWFTTDHSYDGSILLPDDTWLYTRTSIAGGVLTTSTSVGNYDDAGGSVYYSEVRTVSATSPAHIVFDAFDFYGSTAAYLTIGEVRIHDSAPPPLGPSRLWVGLKNSDDQGTQFDLRAEVYKNSTTLLTSGETLCITGITRNANLAKEVEIGFQPMINDNLQSGDQLSLRVLTRVGTNPDGTRCSGPSGSHNNATGLRLYYDSTIRPSRFGAEVPPNPLSGFFLHPGFEFDTAAPTGTNTTIVDSPSVNFSGGNTWRQMGVWSMVVQ